LQGLVFLGLIKSVSAGRFEWNLRGIFKYLFLFDKLWISTSGSVVVGTLTPQIAEQGEKAKRGQNTASRTKSTVDQKR
jgi:hypothetical protein